MKKMKPFCNVWTTMRVLGKTKEPCVNHRGITRVWVEIGVLKTFEERPKERSEFVERGVVLVRGEIEIF